MIASSTRSVSSMTISFAAPCRLRVAPRRVRWRLPACDSSPSCPIDRSSVSRAFVRASRVPLCPATSFRISMPCTPPCASMKTCKTSAQNECAVIRVTQKTRSPSACAMSSILRRTFRAGLAARNDTAHYSLSTNVFRAITSASRCPITSTSISCTPTVFNSGLRTSSS